MKQFNERVNELQAHITEIKKDGKVSAGNTKYNYLKLDKIIENVKAKASELKINIFIRQDKEYGKVEKREYSNKYDKPAIEWIATGFAELIFADGQEEQAEGEVGKEIVAASSIISASNTDPAKAVGSMITYGRRYLYEVALNIVGDLSLDPDEKTNEPKFDKAEAIKFFTTLPEATQTAYKTAIKHDGGWDTADVKKLEQLYKKVKK